MGPSYTRIVIGVNGEVGLTPSACRRPTDWCSTSTNSRPSPELMGKTFPVEDRLLRQIRVACYKPTVTRIVSTWNESRTIPSSLSQSFPINHRHSRPGDAIGEERACQGRAGRAQHRQDNGAQGKGNAAQKPSHSAGVRRPRFGRRRNTESVGSERRSPGRKRLRRRA